MPTDNKTAYRDSSTQDDAIALFVTAQLTTFSGDSDVDLPGCFQGILTGSEGSWTFTKLVAGAGAVDGGTQRMTLASDDPAVAMLGTINGKTPALGQALAAASVPVVLTAAQIATLTPPAAIAGFATAANQTTANTALSAIQTSVASAATLAEQQSQTTALNTVIGHVDGVESALTNTNAFLDVLDDWDETNRCKVNLVVGQSGITAGAGAVAANTPRVTLASDDPAVAALAEIKTAVELLDNAISGNAFSVVNAGTFPAQVDGDALTALQLIDDAVFQKGTAVTNGDKGFSAYGVASEAPTGFSGVIAGDHSPFVVDLSGRIYITGQLAHDEAVAGNPVRIGGYASAAAPSDVSGDGDTVNAWYLRNGAAATALTAAGALIGGDAANGLDVDVTRLPALVAGSATIGNVGLVPRATDGLTPYSNGALSNTVVDVGSTAATGVYLIDVFNPAAARTYVQFFNAAAAGVTLGTTAPFYSIAVRSSAERQVQLTIPIGHGTALSIAATTTRAGSTAPATAAEINIWYKQ
jgi:hypothetical protein